MARMYANCLIFVTMLVTIFAPVSLFAAPAPKDARFVAKTRIAGFEWDLNVPVYESSIPILNSCLLSGRQMEPVATNNCPAEAFAAMDRGRVTRTIDCRIAIDCGKNTAPVPTTATGLGPFSTASLEVLKRSVLDLDFVASFCPLVSKFFYAVYENVTLNSLVANSLVANAHSELQFGAYELFADTDDIRRSNPVALDSNQEFFSDGDINVVFAEIPDSYWRYYEDCDRWEVDFVNQPAADSANNGTGLINFSSIISQANDIVREIRESVSGRYEQIQFAVVETPELFLLDREPLDTLPTTELGATVSTEVSNPPTRSTGPFDVVSEAIRAAWRLQGQVRAHVIDWTKVEEAWNLARQQSLELEQKQFAAARADQVKLNRYLVPRIKWLNENLSEIVTLLEEPAEKIAGRKNDSTIK